MKTSGNRNFEEEWKDAMEGAEMTPSDRVWNSIDLKLSHAERGEMKKRVLFYQRLAAASILFALCLGAAGWFWYEKTGTKSLANQTTGAIQNESVAASPKTADSEITDNSSVATSVASPNVNSTTRTTGSTAKGGNILNGEHGKSRASEQEVFGGNNLASVAVITSKNALSFVKEAKPENQLTSENNSVFDNENVAQLSTNSLLISAVRLTGKPVEQIESARTFKIAKKEEKNSPIRDGNWWASLNGSGGAYSQSSSSNSIASNLFQSTTSSLNTAPNSKEAGVGTSFSYGMSVGKKIGYRWVLMSGVNYMNQSIDYNSNIVLQDASQSRAFVADLASFSSSLSSTTPYLLRNTNEFVSIPLQAGYLLINRKTGVQLNAGVAADIFYRNTMTDLSGKFGSFSQDAGENSTYRSLNWTGLLGTELSYKMNKHYHVSLIPGFRYSFNSVLKSSTGSTINPLVWDVGFRLKYVF